jgi:hypothetical protein
MAAAPTIPAIPVTVANTPLPVTGAVSISGTPSVNVTNTSLTVGNQPNNPLTIQDVNKTPARLVRDGQAFDLPPNPNIAFEFDLPTNVVLTDVEVSLNEPALAATIFVSEMDNSKTYLFQSVGSPGSTWSGSTEGHSGIHLQSGLSSSIGLRVGIYCNNIGGNHCAGALMWSGYQQ